MADRNGRFAQGNGVIAAAIVMAALILSWGSSGSQPRFQLAASGNAVVRLDTDSGEMLGCDMQGCRRIEAPLRAKTWGPFKMVIGSNNQIEKQQNAQQQQLPVPAPRKP
jgi:hypothetical protein